jgi:hypothetical protein
LIADTKITSITESDLTPTSISLTAAQYSSALTNKFVNFTATVSGVASADVTAMLLDAKVAAISVSDSSAAIASNLDNLHANIGKITSIVQSGSPSALAITATQLLTDADAISAITGTYSLAVSDVSIASLASVSSNSHVASIIVTDSASNISAHLTDLLALGSKLTSITETGTIAPVALTVGQYSSALTAKFTNFTAALTNIKVGTAQVLNRLSYQSFISHLRRVTSPSDKTGNNGKIVKPRKLHGTSWGCRCDYCLSTWACS